MPRAAKQTRRRTSSSRGLSSLEQYPQDAILAIEASLAARDSSPAPAAGLRIRRALGVPASDDLGHPRFPIECAIVSTGRTARRSGRGNASTTCIDGYPPVRWRGCSLVCALIADVNPVVRGWCSTFARATRRRSFIKSIAMSRSGSTACDALAPAGVAALSTGLDDRRAFFEPWGSSACAGRFSIRGGACHNLKTTR